MDSFEKTASAQDFDFFMGKWNVQHLRLKERLAHCNEWQEFDGTSVAQPLLGGLGNIDDNVLHLPDGTYRAATLRAFDPATQEWSIWWLDGRNPGQLDAPMRGKFSQGIGEFYADDVFKGIPIKVRFLWDARNPDQPTWAQAFSADGGATWETNWVMRFLRRA
ncbi:MAG: DUF1579 domain-containing protein [Burkholderiaceae bacterium]